MLCFDFAIESNPKYFNALYGKADTLYDLQRYDEAIKLYDKLLERNKPDIDLLYMKGSCLLELERYWDAANLFNKLIELDPNKAEFWYQKSTFSYILFQRGFDRPASFFINRALEIDPNNEVALERKKQT